MNTVIKLKIPEKIVLKTNILYYIRMLLSLLIIMDIMYFFPLPIFKYLRYFCLVYSIYKIKYILKISKKTKLVKNMLYIQLLTIFYLYCISLINHNFESSIYSHIQLLIYIIPQVVSLLIFYEKNSYNLQTLFNMIIISATIQMILCISSIIFPYLHTYFLNILRNNGYLLAIDINFRSFGLANSLNFITPAIQVLVGCLSLSIFFKYSKLLYLLLSALLFFSGIVNSRTSIVIACLGITLLVLNNFKSHLSLKKCIAISIFMVLLYIFLNTMSIYLEDNFNWLNSGIQEIFTKVGSGSNEGYFSYLFDAKRWTLPDGLYFILGTGQSKFTSSSTFTTDVGYVNQIWIGGMIYLCSLIYTILFLVKDNIPHQYKIYIYIITISIFILNFKGFSLIGNELFNLLFLLSVFFNFQNKGVK